MTQRWLARAGCCDRRVLQLSSPSAACAALRCAALRCRAAQEPENAHSHLLSMVLGNSETIPITGGKLALGTWQVGRAWAGSAWARLSTLGRALWHSLSCLVLQLPATDRAEVCQLIIWECMCRQHH